MGKHVLPHTGATNNGNATRTSEETIKTSIEGARVRVSGAATIDLPLTAGELELVPEGDRTALFFALTEAGAANHRRIRESAMGDHLLQTVDRLFERLGPEIDALMRSREEVGEERIKKVIDDHLAPFRKELFRLTDPSSTESIGTTMRHLMDRWRASIVEEAAKAIGSGETGPLAEWGKKLTEEVRQGVTAILEKQAARHLVETTTAASGPVFEEALLGMLVDILGPFPDHLEDTRDIPGHLRRKTGDLVQSVVPGEGQSPVARVVWEMKRRGEGSPRLSLNALRQEVDLAMRNREAQVGVVIIDSPELLLAGRSYMALGPRQYALAYAPTPEFGAVLALMLRIARVEALAVTADGEAEGVDVDRLTAIGEELRAHLGALEGLHSDHAKALRAIEHSDDGLRRFRTAMVASLSRLDAVLRS